MEPKKLALLIFFLIPLITFPFDKTLALLLFLFLIEKLFFIFPSFGIEFTTLPTLYLAIRYNLFFSFLFNLIFVPLVCFVKSYYIEGNREKLPFPESGHVIDFLVAFLAFSIKPFLSDKISMLAGIAGCLGFKHLLSFLKARLTSGSPNLYEVAINIIFNLVIFYFLV